LSVLTDEPLISPAQAAKRLGVSDDTVRRYIESGQLEGYRLGAGSGAPFRTTESAIREFVRSGAAHDAAAVSEHERDLSRPFSR
jgi:excisionase family DNA binding protein